MNLERIMWNTVFSDVLYIIDSDLFYSLNVGLIVLLLHL